MSRPARAATGRLAPSPTGVLHLGNARSFLLAWLSIRQRGGRLLLRIEDIDGPRLKSGAEAATIEDLRWLGLDWDGPVMRQSERLSLYAEAARRLIERGLAYPCVCSRREIEEAASAPHEDGLDGPVYPGTCRDRFDSFAEARRVSGRDPALRFRVERDAFPYRDLVRGPEDGRVSGDFVIVKRDGGPAYQLAVVVDDADQGVDEVLRADDLVASTPRQLLLYDALGLGAPCFAHVPLVVGPDGLRLAKRHGDSSLASFRGRGIAAERIVGLLAWSLGLRAGPEPCRPEDLLGELDFERLPRGPFVFRDEMLA
ncbi:MAG: tRNA glutamyl-Q(34) synthetase GluQRS [Planctomycetes bacterium]|nr:tRNA glutamyl-Q(34) synthetase GluQRS [Planctomycetota bacterium]